MSFCRPCWEALADAYLARGSYTSALKCYNICLELSDQKIYPSLQIANIKKVNNCFIEHFLANITMVFRVVRQSFVLEFLLDVSPIEVVDIFRSCRGGGSILLLMSIACCIISIHVSTKLLLAGYAARISVVKFFSLDLIFAISIAWVGAFVHCKPLDS